MATIIEQKPYFTKLPVGQDVVFVVSNNTIVAAELKVKFIAKVHISSGNPPNVTTSDNLIGTFKTTPNNAGVGIFNFRDIVENYVKPDNMAADGSSYKGTETDSDNHHPIHLIDKYSVNNNAIRYLSIEFGIEYLGATDCNGGQDDNVIRESCGEEEYSTDYTLFNAYLKYDDVLTVVNNDFGYDVSKFNPGGYITSQILTNIPNLGSTGKVYATKEDYGTLAFFNPNDDITNWTIEIYHAGGIYSLNIPFTSSNGAYNGWNAETSKQLVYFGCYPGNLREQYWFNYYLDTMTHYDVYAIGSGSVGMMSAFSVHILCPDLRGYDPIRLAWLNQWGVWDYFTFNKKSTKSLSAKGTTYNQLEGTWNEGIYRADSSKGGKKTFNVNATEKIKMNTDYVSEDNNVLFEELINSPEVYILEGFQTDITNSALNQYVTPVRLTTSNFTRKTVANDRLIQYTFEVEKTKTLRTQSV